jgi:hypothetical protein
MRRNCEIKKSMQMRIYGVKFFSFCNKKNLSEEEKEVVY